MQGSDGDNGSEGREFVGDTQDSWEPTGLKEEEGDVCVVKAGPFLRR